MSSLSPNITEFSEFEFYRVLGFPSFPSSSFSEFQIFRVYRVRVFPSFVKAEYYSEKLGFRVFGAQPYWAVLGRNPGWSWTLPGCQPMTGQPKEGTQFGLEHSRDASL